MDVIDDKSGHKIFVFTARFSRLMQRHTNEFVASAQRAIPRAMLRGKNIALIFCGELFTRIKSQLQRCVMRLQEYIRFNELLLELRMFTDIARILMTSHIPPR